MLAVQTYLREKCSLTGSEDLALKAMVEDFAIRLTFSPTEPLVILNYDQIESNKRHPIVQECRGLTLEFGSWNVVARAFTRFFNAGECPDQERKFDWDEFIAETKEDGSLILLYRYKDSWRVNTRGSFALGEIGHGVGKTWEEVFYEGIDETAMDDLNPAYTYVFELCSPYNKVVRRYDTTTLFLLTAFHNKAGFEQNEFVLDREAAALGVRRPGRHRYRNLEAIRHHLENVEQDPTFEGFVLRDGHGMRLKVKNSRYVALHHLHSNGNIFHPKNLLPLVIKGEQDEVLAYFPEVGPHYFEMVEKLEGAKARLLAVWEAASGIKSQKEFALFVNKHTPLASILFEARKRNVFPEQVWQESGDLLLKRLYSKVA